MPDELLPKVDLCRISGPVLQVLADLVHEAVREAFDEKGRKGMAPAGALRAAEAARYLGLGRSRFYTLLDEHPQLLAASFTVGKARMWSTASLDAWITSKHAGERG